MGTFPPVTTPTPNQPLWNLARQVLGGTAASVTMSGIGAQYKTFRLEVRISKDGTSSGISLQLNGGAGGVDWVADAAVGATFINVGALGVLTIPLATAGSSPAMTMAANRDGLWSVYIAQNPPHDAGVIVDGGFFQSGSAVVVNWNSYGIWYLVGQSLTTITISADSGNLAANSAFSLTGDDH